MARCGSSRDAELRTTCSVGGGQRRSTSDLEPQLEARFGSHRRDVGAGEEKGRERRPPKI
eukprot:3791233-Pleurochrysis_carterae.AAC.1